MSTKSILIVEKSGILKTVNVKLADVDSLCKRAGFKTSNDFAKHHTYEFTYKNMQVLIDLYGKLKGKANSENKYDLPPPMDNHLFFGSMILTRRDPSTQNLVHLSMADWEKYYEHLFGGFHDTNDNDDVDEDEKEIIREEESFTPNQKTKDGYVKDGFIVDDGEEEEDVDGEDVGEEEDVESMEEDDSSEEGSILDEDFEVEELGIEEEQVEEIGDMNEEDEYMDESESDEDEDDETYKPPKRAKKAKVVSTKKKGKCASTEKRKTRSKASVEPVLSTEYVLDCSEELEEEEYV